MDNNPLLRFIAGLWSWVFPCGRVLPYVCGGDGDSLGAAQLLERRDALIVQLEDPAWAGDHEALMAEVTSLRQQLADLETAEQTEQRQAAEANARRAALAQLRGVRSPAQPARPGALVPPSQEVLDWAQRFVDSEGLQRFRSSGYKGRVGVDLASLDIRSVINALEQRAPLDNTGTSAGAFQNPTRSPVVPMTNMDRPPRLADLIDRQTTGDNTVEYVRETTTAGAGGTAAAVAEGAAKPEAAFTFEVVTDSVRTIAHWVQITRQAASDNQQIMGHIRGRLTYGLQWKLDADIINGNGTAPNLRGILQTSGRNVVAPVAAEARVITIRKGITQCQIDEYQPNVAVLHPSDWELVELSTDSQGMFRVSPSVLSALVPRIWGLTVVPTTAIAAGTGLVGDFRMGATLWDRQQPQLYITDSHASTFISNILTLLAELRAALSVWRPAAFAELTFNGAI